MKRNGVFIVLWACAVGCGGSAANSDAGADGTAASNACQQIAALDHSCATDADCAAVHHMTNCCGGMAWIGVRTSERTRFATLEQQCIDSYPACGCFDGRDSTDDGSRLPPGSAAAATCVAGVCKTYAPGCGAPCASGSSCRICTDTATGAVTSTCALQCTNDSMCDAGASRCSLGQTTGLCTPANSSCEPAN
jgi:hypothetical protein